MVPLALVATVQAATTSWKMFNLELNERLFPIDLTLLVVLTRITEAILEIMPRMTHHSPWTTTFIDDSSSYER
jgi:hypothetical protein